MKKYSKTFTNPSTGRKNTVRYGDPDYTIAPGTKRGDNYCTRSLGINKKFNIDCKANPNTPNCLSRKKWNCVGKRSLK